MERPATVPEMPPSGPPEPAPDAVPAPEEPPKRSPAHEYRRRRDRRRSQFTTTVYGLLVLGILNFAGYFAIGASGPGLSAAPLGPTPVGGAGPVVEVTFGPPALHSVTCGNGRNTTVESVPWVTASTPLVTGQVYLEVEEQLDSDIDGGPEPTPEVTATSDCAGAPLSTAPSWYVVLVSPSGENLAVFSYSTNWIVLGHTANVPIADGSTMDLLADPELSGTSLSLCALGDLGSTGVQGCQYL